MCGVWRLAVAALVLAAAGCGDAVAVSGKVTLDGVPVESGTVTFVPEDTSKGQGAGATITNGEYKIEGVGPPPGSYRVEIKSQKKTGKKVVAGSPAPPGTMVDETVEAIPAKYNAKSELKAVLKSGANPLDFELKGRK